MKRKIEKVLYVLTALFLFGAVTQSAHAQVTVDAKIDSLVLLIGEQTNITLEVSMDAGSNFRMPVFDKNILVPGVEIVETAKPDTQALNDGKRWLINQVYTVTSFDTAVYAIPPFSVAVNDKSYESNPLALKVLTFDVDTLNVDQFFGAKDIMSPAFLWSDWEFAFWMSILVLLCTGCALYLIIRYRDNKPIIKIIKVTPKIPPHQKAIQEIEHIKHEKKWTQEDSKEYYTKLTDALRTYIFERYGFNAMEMTSNEIIDKLISMQDTEALAELRELFYTADLVKFAKHSTLINENDMNLVNAIDFINHTKVEEAQVAKQEPREIKVAEKRSLSARRKLLIGIIVLGVVAVAGLVLVAISVVDLCI